MISIEIQRPGARKPLKRELPSSFDELTAAKLVFWAQCVLSNLPFREALRRIAFRFSGIPIWYFSKLTRTQQMAIEEAYEWLAKPYRMEKWLINELRPLGRRFVGPGHRMMNMTSDEFSECDRFFNLYRQNKDRRDLNKMLACMYRPASGGTPNDPRRPFYSGEVSTRAFWMRFVPMRIRYAVFLNYIGVRELMPQKFPNIFSSSNEQRANKYGWPGLIIEMAGAKIGNVKEVEKYTIWNLLFIAERNEEMRIESERNKRANGKD